MATPASQENPAPKRPRMVWRLILGLGSLILMLGILAGGIVAVMSGQTVETPDWVTERLETAINAEIAPARVGITGLDVTFRDRAAPLVAVKGVRIFDHNDRFLAWVPNARLSIDRSALLSGRVSLQSVRVDGYRMSLRRDRNGVIDFALGQSEGASEIAGTPAELLDGLNAIFAAPGLEALQEISATDVRFLMNDEFADRLWDVKDGELVLKRTDAGADLRVSFSTEGHRGVPADVAFSVLADSGSLAAQLGLSISNLATKDIAFWDSSLTWMQVLDAPTAGSLRMNLGEDGNLSSVSAALDIGQGMVSAPGAEQAIAIEGGRAYFGFDPVSRRVQFDQISVETSLAKLSGDGQILLDSGPDETDLIAQIQFSDVVVYPSSTRLDEPVSFDEGAVDMRFGFNPFRIDVGQMALTRGETRILGSGRAAVHEGGMDVGVDVHLDQISSTDFLALWPQDVVVDTREWLGENLKGGMISEASASLRTRRDNEPVVAVGFTFDDAILRFLPEQPPLVELGGYGALENGKMTIVSDRAFVDVGDAGRVDASGTIFSIEDVSARPGVATIDIRADGPLSAQLQLLDNPPFGFLSRANQSPDVATGHALTEARVRLPLLEIVPDDQIYYEATAVAADVVADTLVEGHTISAKQATVSATRRDGLRIAAAAEFSGIPFEGEWVMPLNEGSDGSSRLTGAATVSQEATERLNIGLPQGTIGGTGLGRVEIDFPQEGDPKLRFFTDMNRLRLRIPQIGWSKPPSRTGELEVRAVLAETPLVESIELSAPGLRATGSLSLLAEGGLDRAALDNVSVGSWFSGPVEIVGRGPDAPVDVVVKGGTLDMRNSAFGASSEPGGKLDVRLDRLVVSEGISLTGVNGRFAPGRGLRGQFTGRVNGGTAVSGTLGPSRFGTAASIQSTNGGRVLSDAGVYENGHDGDMDLSLIPREQDGYYDGSLTISGARVRNAPALAELLSAVSVVGLLEQLDGRGLVFDTIAADFVLTPDSVIIENSRAVGASLGLTMDGGYDLENGSMDMQGVVTPIYIVNAIGQLVSRQGEGLVGITYRMKGSPDDPKVTINPLSLLTPGFLREIFRKPAPKVEE